MFTIMNKSNSITDQKNKNRKHTVDQSFFKNFYEASIGKIASEENLKLHNLLVLLRLHCVGYN